MIYPDKIEVVLTYKHESDSSDFFTEHVTAIKLGEYFKLIHPPSFASNLAVGDIIKVEYDDNEFHFDELIEESGHSVVHVIIFNMNSKEELISKLEIMNCEINGEVANNYLILDIPPASFYEPIHSLLTSEETSGNVSFQESCLSKNHIIAHN